MKSLVWARALVLVAGFCIAGQGAFAQSAPDGKIAVEDLLKPGEVEDVALGDAKAPVTVIEYASLTCPHCASFHKNSLPSLLKDFVASGKVRFIFRDFPFDGLALAGTMIARCSGPEKFFKVVDTLFEEQEAWAFSKEPEAGITAIAVKHGFTQETFNACLQNQKIYDGVLAVRQRAYDVFGVNSTPTIFVNGDRYRGALSPGDLAEAVKSALSAAAK